MTWQKLPTWTKGAIIGLVVGIIYNLLLLITLVIASGRGVPEIIQVVFAPITALVNLWCNYFTRCVGDLCFCNNFIPQIFLILFIVVIGALIGKIKSK